MRRPRPEVWVRCVFRYTRDPETSDYETLYRYHDRMPWHRDDYHQGKGAALRRAGVLAYELDAELLLPLPPAGTALPVPVPTPYPLTTTGDPA